MSSNPGLLNREINSAESAKSVGSCRCNLAKLQSNILVFDSPEQVALAAAERFVTLTRESLEEHQLFSVCLSGGNTPRRMYELLSTEPFCSRIEWSRVHVFFGDERPVPSDHPDSNYRLAHDALISHVPLPANNVHPINGAGDAVSNARLYEGELRSFFAGSEWPRFDLVILGLGQDGHTASLFPGSDALNETRAWVVANWIEKLKAYRITLTPPAINAAANVEFLVTGRDKAEALDGVLNRPAAHSPLPAQLIKPESGPPTWLVDAHAAGTRP